MRLSGQGTAHRERINLGRIEIRLGDTVKRPIEQAASIDDKTVSAFIAYGVSVRAGIYRGAPIPRSLKQPIPTHRSIHQRFGSVRPSDA